MKLITLLEAFKKPYNSAEFEAFMDNFIPLVLKKSDTELPMEIRDKTLETYYNRLENFDYDDAKKIIFRLCRKYKIGKLFRNIIFTRLLPKNLEYVKTKNKEVMDTSKKGKAIDFPSQPLKLPRK